MATANPYPITSHDGTTVTNSSYTTGLSSAEFWNINVPKLPKILHPRLSFGKAVIYPIAEHFQTNWGGGITGYTGTIGMTGGFTMEGLRYDPDASQNIIRNDDTTTVAVYAAF